MAEADSSSVDSDYAEILVVRHGETVWNADGRIQGTLDVELNDAGRQQAAALGDRLSKDPKISLVYSSDLSQAYETAQIIASRCGGLKVVTDPDLRERHKGVLQGLAYHEIPKPYPEAHQAFLSGDTSKDFPGCLGRMPAEKLFLKLRLSVRLRPSLQNPSAKHPNLYQKKKNDKVPGHHRSGHIILHHRIPNGKRTGSGYE
ncbi:unnamed protein product [Malus baccata var. baccata]